MAPSSFFSFRELRRRSRASFRTEPSTDTSSEGGGSHGASPTTGSLTPPSLVEHSEPALNAVLREKPRSLPALERPPAQALSQGSNNNKRHSVSGMAGLGSSPTLNGRGPSLPVSQYSPHITNASDNTWVFQKALLLHGTVGDPSQQLIDGTITCSRADDAFPPTSWPVTESRFKILVYMMPGANRIRFDFASPKLANSGTSNPIHASWLTIHYLPPINSPPLQLAIVLGKDSPGTFDAVPARVEREGNGLDLAMRKFRMAAYLWQAFTGEQMWRNKLGRRTFRFEEEWMTGSANQRDRECGTMRSEARVHVIRSDKTVAELRDLNRAQQNADATDSGALFGIAADAVKEYFKPLPGQKLYVSVLLLDSHWDPSSQVITGHAALGGVVGDVHLGIFGSHCLQSYPSSIEEVVPAFSDCTLTDANFVGNDCNEAGSSWEAANIGIGAHLHETGHLLGLPHRESGIMLRDYVSFNRSFMPYEPSSTRTKSRGGPVNLDDECAWHRLDCLRFRSHPCFRLPNDPTLNPDESVHAWPIENGNIALTAATGVSYIELYSEGDDICRSWIEYPAESGSSQRLVLLSEQDFRNRMPEDKRKSIIKIHVKSHGGGDVEIQDLKKFASKASSLKLPNTLSGMGKMAFRGKQLGLSNMEGSEPHELIFSSSLRQDRVLSRIIFHHGIAVDGLEFVYDDESRQLFGKRGDTEGGDIFELDVRRGEYINGFIVRSGFWIDAIQVLTSTGRKSPLYGSVHKGSAHTLIPPRGYTICGVTGSCGPWVDGFSVIITR